MNEQTRTLVEVECQAPQLQTGKPLESPALKRAIQNAASSAEEKGQSSKFLASFY
jgi:hypothetical protein